MSEHDQYWRNRKNGRRGQGNRHNHKYYAKGESIKYRKWDTPDIESEYANAEGSHGIINTKGQLVKLNRKQYRLRSPSRMASKKGYKSHKINTPKYVSDIDPAMSNHARHLERRKLKQLQA